MQVWAAPKPQDIFMCKHDNYHTLSEIHRNIILHVGGKVLVVAGLKLCSKLDTGWLQNRSSAEHC